MPRRYGQPVPISRQKCGENETAGNFGNRRLRGPVQQGTADVRFVTVKARGDVHIATSIWGAFNTTWSDFRSGGTWHSELGTQQGGEDRGVKRAETEGASCSGDGDRMHACPSACMACWRLNTLPAPFKVRGASSR